MCLESQTPDGIPGEYVELKLHPSTKTALLSEILGLLSCAAFNL